MLESQADSLPKVRIALELESLLYKAISSDSLRNKMAHEGIERGAAEIMEALGILGEPEVVISEMQEDAPHLLRLVVNDRLCRYPGDLLKQVYNYVNGALAKPDTDQRVVDDWISWLLTDFSVADSETHELSRRLLVEYLALVCRHIIQIEPSVLLGPDQFGAYLESMQHSSDEPGVRSSILQDSEWLFAALGRLLDLKISIADKSSVRKVIENGLQKERSRNEIVEDLIAALRADTIEIQLPEDYLRGITLADTKRSHDSFTYIRRSLFSEMGLTYPDCKFITADGLKPYSFAFKINHLTTLPHMGLRPDDCAVIATSERLDALGIPHRTATNPANQTVLGIIDASSYEIAEAEGLTALSPMDYVAISLYGALKQNAKCLINSGSVAQQFSQLEQTDPALVATLETKATIEQRTTALRALVAEEVSIHDLRLIGERIVDYDYVIIDPSDYILFDDRIPVREEPGEDWINDPLNLTSFIRIGMKNNISSKYLDGRGSLNTLSLAPETEEMVREIKTRGTGGVMKETAGEAEHEILLSIVRDALSYAASADIAPVVLLTSTDTRATIRGIVAGEFPYLPVLSYQEISPQASINPIILAAE